MKSAAVVWLATAMTAGMTGFLMADGGFELTCPAVKADGVLPAEFTGDGAGISPPLEWTGAPAGTKAYALIMHHVDPEGVIKWYWTLYNIPATATALSKNAKGVGLQGNNSVNHRAEYAPPHSKGPGLKTYICTLYALSEPLALTCEPQTVTRAVLLEAMQGKILGRAELRVTYTRPASAFRETTPPQGGKAPPPPPGNEPPPEK